MRSRSHERVVIDGEASSTTTLRRRSRRRLLLPGTKEEEEEKEGSSSFRNLLPVLRRAGSSTTLSEFSFSSKERDDCDDDYGIYKHEEAQTDDGSYFNGSGDEDDDDDEDEEEELPIVNKPRHFALPQNGTIITQVLQQGILLADLQSNGLPWVGMQCRSARAGLTGAFFAIPALAVIDAPYEQAWWVLQAVTSVMADYCYIHSLSAWHGIDRIVAQLSLLGLVGRGFFFLHWWAVTLLVITPVSCFMAASAAKGAQNLNKWHNCHFLWHLVAPIACTVGVYLTYRCPSASDRDTIEPEFLKMACLPSNQ